MNRHAYLARAATLREEATELEREDQPRRAAELREVADALERAVASGRARRRLLGQLLRIDFDA